MESLKLLNTSSRRDRKSALVLTMTSLMTKSPNSLARKQISLRLIPFVYALIKNGKTMS